MVSVTWLRTNSPPLADNKRGKVFSGMANVGKPRHETFTGNTRRRPEQYSLKM